MDPVTLAAVAVSVLAVCGVGVAAYQLTADRGRTAADRLAEISEGDGRKARASGIATSAARLASAGEGEELAALRRWLIQAGYRDKNAVEMYSASRAIGAIVLGLLGLLITIRLQLLFMMIGALTGAAAGYYLPAIWVTNTLQNRQQSLLRSFPDALDLLVSSVEAGLGIDSAFRRVAEELDASAPDLSRELQYVSHEVNAGIPRVEALRHLSDRTGLEEIGQLVNVLVQAERFGTSVARSLRIHSEMVRTKRMQKAEAAAAQVSPKLTVVMLIFILPCLFIILCGPAAINITRILAPTMQEQGSQ